MIAAETATSIDEFRRFRHVVRNVYAFELDEARVDHLARSLRPTFASVSDDLCAFATILESLAEAG